MKQRKNVIVYIANEELGYIDALQTALRETLGELTVVTDTVYDVNVAYRTYTVNVNGIHRADGTISADSR